MIKGELLDQQIVKIYSQMHIYNPVNNLRWRFLREELTVKNLMFDWILNAPLYRYTEDSLCIQF